jgi:hypothetical protein
MPKYVPRLEGIMPSNLGTYLFKKISVSQQKLFNYEYKIAIK